MSLTKKEQPRSWHRAWLCLFALGATLGVALDAIHAHLGATVYANPVWWRLAWWTPLLFGSAFTIGLVRPLLDSLTTRRHPCRVPPPRRSEVGIAMGLFVAAYFTTVLPLPWPLVAALLVANFGLGFWLCDRSRTGLGIALCATLGGAAVESFLIAHGRFCYVKPVYLGLAGWLPFLYLSAAVALTTLARWLMTPGEPSEAG